MKHKNPRYKTTLNALACFLVALLFAVNPITALLASSNELNQPDVAMETQKEEILILRDPYTKTFINADNTYTAVMFPDEIHYRNEDGEYDEVDNSLTLNDFTKRYENLNNTSFQIGFPGSIEDGIIFQIL